MGTHALTLGQHCSRCVADCVNQQKLDVLIHHGLCHQDTVTILLGLQPQKQTAEASSPRLFRDPAASVDSRQYLFANLFIVHGFLLRVRKGHGQDVLDA